MTLEELRTRIDESMGVAFPIIFRDKSGGFIPHQYISEIIKNNNYIINYVDELSPELGNSFINDENILTIFRTDKFQYIGSLENFNNLIVICSECSAKYKEIIIDVPKLEKWQIIDYAYSITECADQNDINTILELCNWDIFCIENELSKISIFDKSVRNEYTKKFLKQGIFTDMHSKATFDFITALCTKNTQKIAELYNKNLMVTKEDIFGIVVLLINNFTDIIKVQLTPYASAESVGIPANKFWVVSKNYKNIFSKQALLRIYNFLTNIDKRLKTGGVDTNYLLDEIIVRILGEN